MKEVSPYRPENRIARYLLNKNVIKDLESWLSGPTKPRPEITKHFHSPRTNKAKRTKQSEANEIDLQKFCYTNHTLDQTLETIVQSEGLLKNTDLNSLDDLIKCAESNLCGLDFQFIVNARKFIKAANGGIPEKYLIASLVLAHIKDIPATTSHSNEFRSMQKKLANQLK